MYKVLLFLKKHCIICYILFYSIIWKLFECFLPSYENAKILVSAFVPAVIFTILNKYICIGYPLKHLILDCDVEKYNKDLNMLKESLKDEHKSLIKPLEHIYLHFTYGPNQKLITDIEKSIESNSKLENNYLPYLYYAYIELGDNKKAEKILNAYKENLKFKRELFASLIYKLLIQKDDSIKEQLITKAKKNTISKLTKTIIYYYLSLYCKQNNNLEEEKEYLEKIVKFGNNTYMAKNAQQWLKNLETND